MGYRRFSAENGGRWEIRIEASGEWRFEPVSGAGDATRRGRPPLYARDPFELSEQELRRILADARPVTRPGAPSPFRDGARPANERPSPFGDDSGSPGKRSPFRDDR